MHRPPPLDRFLSRRRSCIWPASGGVVSTPAPGHSTPHVIPVAASQDGPAPPVRCTFSRPLAALRVAQRLPRHLAQIVRRPANAVERCGCRLPDSLQSKILGRGSDEDDGAIFPCSNSAAWALFSGEPRLQTWSLVIQCAAPAPRQWLHGDLFNAS